MCTPSDSQFVLELVNSDSGRRLNSEQLCFFADLLFGSFQQEALFYSLSWSSHLLKHSVTSVGAAETLAVSREADEEKIFKMDGPLLLCTKICFLVALDFNNLFTSLSALHNSIQLTNLYKLFSMLFGMNPKLYMLTKLCAYLAEST